MVRVSLERNWIMGRLKIVRDIESVKCPVCGKPFEREIVPRFLSRKKTCSVDCLKQAKQPGKYGKFPPR